MMVMITGVLTWFDCLILNTAIHSLKRLHKSLSYYLRFLFSQWNLNLMIYDDEESRNDKTEESG